MKASSELWIGRFPQLSEGSSSLMEEDRKVTSDTTIVDDSELSNLLAEMCAPCGQNPPKQNQRKGSDADTHIILFMMQREPVYDRKFFEQLRPQNYVYMADPRTFNSFFDPNNPYFSGV